MKKNRTNLNYRDAFIVPTKGIIENYHGQYHEELGGYEYYTSRSGCNGAGYYTSFDVIKISSYRTGTSEHFIEPPMIVGGKKIWVFNPYLYHNYEENFKAKHPILIVVEETGEYKVFLEREYSVFETLKQIITETLDENTLYITKKIKCVHHNTEDEGSKNHELDYLFVNQHQISGFYVPISEILLELHGIQLYRPIGKVEGNLTHIYLEKNDDGYATNDIVTLTNRGIPVFQNEIQGIVKGSNILSENYPSISIVDIEKTPYDRDSLLDYSFVIKEEFQDFYVYQIWRRYSTKLLGEKVNIFEYEIKIDKVIEQFGFFNEKETIHRLKTGVANKKRIAIRERIEEIYYENIERKKEEVCKGIQTGLYDNISVTKDDAKSMGYCDAGIESFMEEFSLSETETIEELKKKTYFNKMLETSDFKKLLVSVCLKSPHHLNGESED